MQEERLRILQMVQAGKITADEAAKLLAALEQSETPAAATSARWLRIRVQDLASGKPKVNINLPLSLLQLALKFVPRGVLQSAGTDIDLESLLTAVKEGAQGSILEVRDEEENVQVEIVVE